MQTHISLVNRNLHERTLTYRRARCFIQYFSLLDLISECRTKIPWHGCYFNSIPQPAENRGLRSVGPSVSVHICPHVNVCVCVCACVHWLSCVATHMWAAIGILLLSTVQRPTPHWTEKIPKSELSVSFNLYSFFSPWGSNQHMMDGRYVTRSLFFLYFTPSSPPPPFFFFSFYFFVPTFQNKIKV